jgi:hypothetical protein
MISAAAFALWSVLVFDGGQPDINSVEQLGQPFATEEECITSADNIIKLIDSNYELQARMLADGYEAAGFICTDDPDPFGVNNE